MEIRTRADIYGKEAAGLLRTLSMYPGISGGQLCRFYSGKEEAVQVLLGHLKKQGRITETRSGGYFLYGQDTVLPDGGMIRAVWVLLDFIERVEFHSAGDFPVKVLFFSDGELYEVIHAAAGIYSLPLLINLYALNRRIDLHAILHFKIISDIINLVCINTYLFWLCIYQNHNIHI